MGKNRSRSYYRAQRRRVIKRRKFTCFHVRQRESLGCNAGFLSKNRNFSSPNRYEKSMNIKEPRYTMRLKEMKKEIDEFYRNH